MRRGVIMNQDRLEIKENSERDEELEVLRMQNTLAWMRKKMLLQKERYNKTKGENTDPVQKKYDDTHTKPDASGEKKDDYIYPDIWKMVSNYKLGSGVRTRVEEISEGRPLRIDIINCGSPENDLNIPTVNIPKGESYTIETPDWFRENGIGHVIETTGRTIQLTVYAENDGEINIYIKGMNKRYRNRKRFPMMIDVKQVRLNGVELLTDHVKVWHDEPFVIRKSVVDGEKIEIEICAE